MYKKRVYKICIRSVTLGELESFRNYKGFSFIIPKILDEIYILSDFYRYFTLHRKKSYYDKIATLISWLQWIFKKVTII